MTVYVGSTATPIGTFAVATADSGELVAAGFETDGFALAGWCLKRGWLVEANALPAEPAVRQVDEYFAGKRRSFDLELAAGGTPFQKKVWGELCRIPFGQTRSYSQIAGAVGEPAAVRAVGRANGSNPIALIVPCHRVIGADGSLTGYAGGLEIKQWLLDFERQDRLF